MRKPTAIIAWPARHATIAAVLVLLGDPRRIRQPYPETLRPPAATKNLAIAGLGAAMAMESAGVLAARIVDAQPHQVPDRLAAFEIQQRKRIQRAQEESRRLARLMFRSELLVTALRDQTRPAVDPW